MPDAHPASSEAVRPLRTRILRPDWPSDRLATYPEDDLTGTIHLAAEHDGEIVGVGTVYPESPPEEHRGAVPDDAYAPGASWRLRGMATSDGVRGRGFGASVLEACYQSVREGGGAFLWCNARLVAVPFYERMGMTAVGDEFDMPGIGPHYVMWRAV